MTSAVGSADALRYPEWVVSACGATGELAFMLMLLPQAIKNFKRQSTQGMSVGSMVIWHVAALLGTAYYLALPEVDIVGAAALGSFALFCGFVEAQAVAYRGRSPRVPGSGGGKCISEPLLGDSCSETTCSSRRSQPPSPKSFALLERLVPLPDAKSSDDTRRLALFTATSVFTILGVLTVVVLCFVFRVIPDDAMFLLGNVASAVLFAIGFLPQMHEFVASQDISGYSFGLTAIDLTGSAANMIVLFAPRSTSLEEAFKEAVPFVSIIIMHLVLILTAVLVVCFPGKREVAAVEEGFLAF